MNTTQTVCRYRRSHLTHCETGVTKQLNQRVGEPCGGGFGVTLDAWSPPPAATMRGHCTTCLAEQEMDLVSVVEITLGWGST
jgi:xanthine/CO dehydrogenase XdhC/CoxF family maturation factor